MSQSQWKFQDFLRTASPVTGGSSSLSSTRPLEDFLWDSHPDDDASQELEEVEDEADSQSEREMQIETDEPTNFYDIITSATNTYSSSCAVCLASASAVLMLALLTILWQ